MAVLNQAVLLKGVNDTKEKMWKLCEVIQEAYVRPYYIFNCSYRNPQFAHLRVPIEVGQDIVEGMYGNISGDAIPRYIATAGGKIPLHRSNVVGRDNGNIILKKTMEWRRGKISRCRQKKEYSNKEFSFFRYKKNKFSSFYSKNEMNLISFFRKIVEINTYSYNLDGIYNCLEILANNVPTSLNIEQKKQEPGYIKC